MQIIKNHFVLPLFLVISISIQSTERSRSSGSAVFLYIKDYSRPLFQQKGCRRSQAHSVCGYQELFFTNFASGAVA